MTEDYVAAYRRRNEVAAWAFMRDMRAVMIAHGVTIEADGDGGVEFAHYPRIGEPGQAWYTVEVSRYFDPAVDDARVTF